MKRSAARGLRRAMSLSTKAVSVRPQRSSKREEEGWLQQLPPGRSCPHYASLSLSNFASRPVYPCSSRVLYVAGGVYGNRHAVDEIERMRRSEEEETTVFFNGDFNFFNVSPDDFEYVNDRVVNVEGNVPLAGNIEREISDFTSASNNDDDDDDHIVDCGCSYPNYVSDTFVSRTNEIVRRLRATCRSSSSRVAGALRELDTSARVRMERVDGEPLHVAVIHGDFESLSGWSLSAESMHPVNASLRSSLGVPSSAVTTSAEDVRRMFEVGKVDVIACSHTCLAYGQTIRGRGGGAIGAVFNNGSAGIGNFKGDHRGTITRIGWREDDIPDEIRGKVLYETFHKEVRGGVAGRRVLFGFFFLLLQNNEVRCFLSLTRSSPFPF